MPTCPSLRSCQFFHSPPSRPLVTVLPFRSWNTSNSSSTISPFLLVLRFCHRPSDEKFHYDLNGLCFKVKSKGKEGEITPIFVAFPVNFPLNRVTKCFFSDVLRTSWCQSSQTWLCPGIRYTPIHRNSILENQLKKKSTTNSLRKLLRCPHGFFPYYEIRLGMVFVHRHGVPRFGVLFPLVAIGWSNLGTRRRTMRLRKYP
jgi:hypothetical protein